MTSRVRLYHRNRFGPLDTRVFDDRVECTGPDEVTVVAHRHRSDDAVGFVPAIFDGVPVTVDDEHIATLIQRNRTRGRRGRAVAVEMIRPGVLPDGAFLRLRGHSSASLETPDRRLITRPPLAMLPYWLRVARDLDQLAVTLYGAAVPAVHSVLGAFSAPTPGRSGSGGTP